MSHTTIVLLTLIAYKVLLLGIGFWALRRVKTDSDFFLAGQGLGAWTAGLSYAASTSSAWVLLGFTGAVFTRGTVALWLIPGIFMGYVMTWLVMGPRLHRDTTERSHITIIDFIISDVAQKWQKRIARIAALMILFCFVFYISSQFQAAGNALGTIFGMDPTKAILLGALIIIIYCLMGGFWAASLTDAVQAFIMLIACLLVPIATLQAAGGLGNVMDHLHTHEAQSFLRFTGESAGFAGMGVAMGLFGTGLGALGQPQLLNRIMAAKDRRTRLQGASITIGWGIIIYSGLITLAFSARALKLDTGGESLFFAAAQAYLPAVLAGIVTAAILSAVMSTVDSLLLAAASSVSHDMKLPMITPQTALVYGRIAMMSIAILAVLMTLYLPEDIFSRVLFSWVALGAAFGPTLLTKCLGWRVKGSAICLAILSGFFIAIISANIDGTFADMVEKWGSWIVGLILLYAGRRR